MSYCLATNVEALCIARVLKLQVTIVEELYVGSRSTIPPEDLIGDEAASALADALKYSIYESHQQLNWYCSCTSFC